jgi:hypothetical protein
MRRMRKELLMPPATGHYCEDCGITIGYPGKCADCLGKSKGLPPIDPPKPGKKGK